ncbi:MAG: hypothetical protein RMJ67_06720 [Elusimicrobiota bacterium]|nr:hypothetical protein [Endomicrobiia bacterium]MDW8166187.1 hypothetical protein [Elusimicrobiota bacterium]
MRKSFIDRFVDLLNALGVKFLIYKNIIWRDYGKFVTPLGPAKWDFSLSREEARYLLSKFSNALFIRWTDGFCEDTHNKEWYYVISDKFIDLEDLSSKNKSEIKRGLRNCVVDRIDSKFIAERGYEVFISAFKRYKGVKTPNLEKKDFIRRFLLLKEFEDIVHHWGVFYNRDLIGYSENLIFGDIEVSYSTIKLHPSYLNLYSSYALIYVMNKYYLVENKVEYVNDGARNILHRTNIQKYLIDKFKFKKAYTNLYVYYKPFLYLLLKFSYPLRGFISKLHPSLDAMYKLEEFRVKK